MAIAIEDADRIDISDIRPASASRVASRRDLARGLHDAGRVDAVPAGKALACHQQDQCDRPGQRAITAETALLLGRFFGTSADFWLGLQTPV